jgi:hypothetical protein
MRNVFSLSKHIIYDLKARQCQLLFILTFIYKTPGYKTYITFSYKTICAYINQINSYSYLYKCINM